MSVVACGKAMRSAEARQRAKKLCVPVALQDLRADRRGDEPQRRADVRLHTGIEMRVVAHLAGELADAHPLARPPQPLPPPPRLAVPEHCLQTERDRLAPAAA